MRRSLENVPAYLAGKPAATLPGVKSFKVSSNENPYSPLPEVLDALSFSQINRYPDFSNTRLRDLLAAKYHLVTDNFATGTGSVGVLQQIVQATCNFENEILHAWRSFEAYPIVAAVNGAISVPVPLRGDESHDLDAMVAAISPRTQLILICQPNNPTGVAAKRDELVHFLDRVPAHITIVIDEAYVEFITDTRIADSLDLFRNYKNVAILRTFSKAYGLAGLRVGYAIAHLELAEAIRKCTLPFGVSNIAEDAAIAALKYEGKLMMRVAHLLEERTRVSDALTTQGWKLSDSQANFVWMRLPGKTELFTQSAAEVGLSVRPYGVEGVRATIGEDEANTRFIELASKFFHEFGQF